MRNLVLYCAVWLRPWDRTCECGGCCRALGPLSASGSIGLFVQAGIMSGLTDIIVGMAKPTVGKRAVGKSRHARMRGGLLPATRAAMTVMFIRKATGGNPWFRRMAI